KQLKNKGFTVTSLNLATTPVLPDNLSVLVIAAPRSQLLPQEGAIINKYVKGGGNLLWLGDTDNDPGLPKLAKSLGVHWLPGFAIFPNFRELGMGNPGIFLAASYPKNAVTDKLDEISVFPLVRALTYSKTGAWRSFPILETSSQAWENVQTTQGPISFNAKKGDIAGPLTIGVAQTREVDVPVETAAATPAKATAKATDPKAGPSPAATEAQADAGKDKVSGNAKHASKSAVKKKLKTQRVVLIGDADFLSNGNIHTLGNSALGVQVMTWLAHRNTALSIQIPKAPDHNLYLPGWSTWMISAGYVVILPLILILFGVFRWVVRRRR
ncbi:MAG TPA: Gldg family protein, partial [Nevskiaceae bacterium]|nr:Gldg family protein [Nevskiaceae bacterium]